MRIVRLGSNLSNESQRSLKPNSMQQTQSNPSPQISHQHQIQIQLTFLLSPLSLTHNQFIIRSKSLPFFSTRQISIQFPLSFTSVALILCVYTFLYIFFSRVSSVLQHHELCPFLSVLCLFFPAPSFSEPLSKPSSCFLHI